jgi:hypothetical protein
MAIFDAKKSVFLTYYIVLTDPARVKEYQERVWTPSPSVPVGVIWERILGGADVQFSAPFRGYTAPADDGAPFIWTPWSGNGETGGPYPLNVRQFERHSGGFLGIGGTTKKFYWMGNFVLAAAKPDPSTGEGGPTLDGETIPIALQANIPPRRWCEGFEVPGELPTNEVIGNGLAPSADASRHAGQYGLAIRGANNLRWTNNLTRLGGTALAQSWERFYIRLRKMPGATVNFYGSTVTSSAGSGIMLSVTSGGQLALFRRDSSTATLIATIADLVEWSGDPAEDAWTRVDLLHNYAGATGSIRVYINGAIVATADVIGGTTHSTSWMGNVNSGANTLELDVDDWICAEVPKLGATETLNSKDWLAGSKVALLRPKAFGGSHSGWTGDFRTALQRVWGAASPVPTTLTSSTALALVDVETDSDQVIDADGQAIGVASMVVALRSRRGTNSGRLGYSLAGAGAVLAAVTESGVLLSSTGVIYTGPGGAAFADVTPIRLQFEKGNDTGAATVATLQAQVELIGEFGPEDHRETEGPTPDFPAPVGTHNYPYPRSPWAREAAAPPTAPYIVLGGTYVGNGTGFDLTFRAPVHFLFIRPTTAGNRGVFWLAGQPGGGHPNFQQGIGPWIAMVEEDLSFSGTTGDNAQQQRFRARITGNDANINANGVTYQYIAVQDPGARFLRLETRVPTPGVATRLHRMVDPDFVPGFALALLGDFSAGSTPRIYAQHPSHAANALVPWDNAALLASAVGDFVTPGQWETRLAMQSIGAAGHTFAFWRRQDGNNDPGEAAAVAFGSYVGDGAASRTISLSPAAGKRLLFAMIFGESGNGVFRDPTHTGTNSTSSGGSEVTTGITAGQVDGFTVGSTVNSNGVVYSYFVLYAATATAGNGGWGQNGEHIPVETAPPVTGPWPDIEDEYPDPVVEEPAPELPDDIATDLTMPCLTATTRIANLALSRIGVSMRIANLATDTSQEADTIRLNYGLDVGKVLRDHAWPFATRYADLVLVGGTETVPVNKDWQYSYRTPTNLLFARRLVPASGRGRSWDAAPHTFRLGSDATGGLLFSNIRVVPGAALQLEYTVRLDCAASAGDPLFRNALAWKLAASIAAPLTRDAKLAELCQVMYERALREAAAAVENESRHEPTGDVDWITGRN